MPELLDTGAGIEENSRGEKRSAKRLMRGFARETSFRQLLSSGQHEKSARPPRASPSIMPF
jgi:hypothetical protein